jgi:hypothetical protein
MCLIRVTLSLGLLTALLWSMSGCAALTQPPVRILEQWQRDDAAVHTTY